MLDEWVKKYGHLRDPVGVLEHGRKCIRPGHKKYKEQFIDPGGRCTKIRKTSLACQIFDPFVLKETSVIALELLADELVHFEQDRGTHLFSNSFQRLLRTEILLAKEHATN